MLNMHDGRETWKIFLWRRLKERDQWEDLGVDRKTIL
jgi:hypothetical protein